MGWEVAEGPVLEAEWLNFDALNLGPDHPARTMQDTFWTDPAEDHLVLRTHTSPVQARTMLSRQPPIYVICPGRVFRTDEYDATHSPVFHQVEGLVVDKGITMAHLKGTLDHFADRDVRRGDHHAVPAVVLPVHRAQRRGRPGLLRLPGRGHAEDCRTCRGEGWIEWGGCGVVNPRVLRACGIDSETLLRLRLRHGHRPDPDVPPRHRGPARAVRGRRPVHDRLRDRPVKAPVSWIRDYVDLPAEVTTEQLAARLTALGLKLEAIEKPGEQIRGPLVVGRVLTMEPEPQKNGKTIKWCTVDVGDANGYRRAAGDRLRRPQLRARRPGRGDPARAACCPGDFEISARKTYGHVSAGMICSARELGLGEDHDGIIVLPEGAGEPGSDARPVLGLDQEVIEFEINPDRAYALSLRGVAREAALGLRRAVPRPGRSATCPRPTATATRSSSTTPPAARCSWPAW